MGSAPTAKVIFSGGRAFLTVIFRQFPRAFRIQPQPFLKPRVRVRVLWHEKDIPARKQRSRCNRPDGSRACTALVEAIHGAYLDAVHDFAAIAAVIHNIIGQLSVLSADRSGELIRDVRPRGARSSAENGRRGDWRRAGRSVPRTVGIRGPTGSRMSSRSTFLHRDTRSPGTHQSADMLHSQL